MKQVVQSVSGGPVRVLDVPRPTIEPTEVLVQTVVSMISPGTEGAVTALAQSSLLAKARARPDLVRQVVARAKSQGLSSTLRTVRARLGQDMPLGYSAAGIVIEVGEAVAHVRPGQMVVTGGAGKANHAEYQAVPGLLCVPVPDGLDAADAAFSTIAAIALHGLRLSTVEVGAKVVVIGLGLVGQLCVRLTMAAGCDAYGLDVAQAPVDVARSGGARADVDSGDETSASVMEWSRGRGADAVLVCASGKDSRVVQRIPNLCRDRATVVVVGDVGLDLDRRPYYEKEISVKLSRSYGPGRYERSYEEWGVDYPAGHLRWTEGRNLEAVLDLLMHGHLKVDDLVTHRYSIEEASAAYALIAARDEPCLGVQLTYSKVKRADLPVILRDKPPRSTGDPGVGWVGTGAFSASTLLPAFKSAGARRLVSAASASGLSARRFADEGGFTKAVSGATAVIEDPDVSIVVIATPHDSHGALTVQALHAGKHVWVEKPLALSEAELEAIDAARIGGGILFVGYNRRFSPAVKAVRTMLGPGSGPVSIVYRVAAGHVPEKHWYGDRRQGGRLLGEVCHFIDTCSAIVGAPVRTVRALSSGSDESLLAEDFVVALGYADGSLASISYSSASPLHLGKERVEVFQGTKQAVIDDYRKVTVDGKIVWDGAQDKGHVAAVRTFWDAVRGNDHQQVESDLLESSRVVLQAAACILTK